MKPRKIIWSPTTRRRQLGPQVEEKVVCQEAQKRCRHHPSTSKTVGRQRSQDHPRVRSAKPIEPRPATRRHVARPVGKANAATKFVP